MVSRGTVFASFKIPSSKSDFVANGMLDSVAERLSDIVMKYKYTWNILDEELFPYLLIIDVDWAKPNYSVIKLEYHALKYFGVKFRVTKPDGQANGTRYIYSYLFDNSFNKYTLSYLLNIINEKFNKLRVKYQIHLYNQKQKTWIRDNWVTFNQHRLDATPLLNFNLSNAIPSIKIHGTNLDNYVDQVKPAQFNLPLTKEDRTVKSPEQIQIVLDTSVTPRDEKDLTETIYGFLSRRFYTSNIGLLESAKGNAICSIMYWFLDDYFTKRSLALSYDMMADIKEVVIKIGENQTDHDPKDKSASPVLGTPRHLVPESEDPDYLAKVEKQAKLRDELREKIKQQRADRKGVPVANGQLLYLAQNLDINIARKLYPLMKQALSNVRDYVRLYTTANAITADLEDLDNTMYEIFKQQISGIVTLPPTLKLVRDGVTVNTFVELTPQFKQKYAEAVQPVSDIDPVSSDPNKAIEDDEKDYAQMNINEKLHFLLYNPEHIQDMSPSEKRYLSENEIDVEDYSKATNELKEELFQYYSVNPEFYDPGISEIGNGSVKTHYFFTDMFEAFYFMEDKDTDDRMRLDRITNMRKFYIMLKYNIERKDEAFVDAVIHSIPVDMPSKPNGEGAEKFAMIIRADDGYDAYSAMVNAFIDNTYEDFPKGKTWRDTNSYTPAMENAFLTNDMPLPSKLYRSSADSLLANWKKIIETSR